MSKFIYVENQRHDLNSDEVSAAEIRRFGGGRLVQRSGRVTIRQHDFTAPMQGLEPSAGLDRQCGSDRLCHRGSPVAAGHGDSGARRWWWPGRCRILS